MLQHQAVEIKMGNYNTILQILLYNHTMPDFMKLYKISLLWFKYPGPMQLNMFFLTS
jgi:hypothetical protein